MLFMVTTLTLKCSSSTGDGDDAVPQLNMACSLCSGFAPGSSGAPGGPWTPLILFPAALPCEGPAAAPAAQKRQKRD